MDYLFFFNANLTCTQTITEEEFLPRPARGENLLLVQQPGFWDKKPPFFSYDRNPKSTAYIQMCIRDRPGSCFSSAQARWSSPCARLRPSTA